MIAGSEDEGSGVGLLNTFFAHNLIKRLVVGYDFLIAYSKNYSRQKKKKENQIMNNIKSN